MKELDELLKGDENDTQAEEEAKAKAEADKQNSEVEKAKQELENLQRAKAEALQEVKRLREEKSKLKSEDSDVPAIDKEDPNSKAWLKEIKDTFNPFQQELEREKEEIFNFSLEEVLRSHPSLASDTERLKKVISTYERIKDNSGRTREGVIMDLNRAMAAENYQEILDKERASEYEKAKDDLVFSAPAISRGSTSYKQEHSRTPNVTNEERKIIEAQGWSVDEWWKAKQKHDIQ